MPRSDYDEHPTGYDIGTGMWTITSAKYDALRARLAEYEARYQADLVQFLAYDKRVTELESQLAAERDALLSSASDVQGMDVRIKELEAAYAEIVNAPYEAAQGRIAELEATMEFYANPDNYKENYDGLNAPYTNVVKDGGKRSRHALERGKP